jgi:hypothetical protein
MGNEMGSNCTCYAVSTDPQRQSMWQRIFPPEGHVPLISPLPVGTANLAAKFKLTEHEIRADIDEMGVPVKASEVMVSWCPLHVRCVS